VLSGPGAGKGTLVDRLVAARPECVFSISATTRPRRSTEVDGVQYEFVAKDEFERRRSAGQFVEWAEVHNQLYATPAKFVDEQVRAGRVVVLDVDVQGGASVRRARTGLGFRLPLDRRCGGGTQGADAPDVVETRLKNAPGELAEWREYDYLVQNDDLEQAVARLTAIVDAERARVRRLQPSS
jgi:guanylate kinase